MEDHRNQLLLGEYVHSYLIPPVRGTRFPVSTKTYISNLITASNLPQISKPGNNVKLFILVTTNVESVEISFSNLGPRSDRSREHRQFECVYFSDHDVTHKQKPIFEPAPGCGFQPLGVRQFTRWFFKRILYHSANPQLKTSFIIDILSYITTSTY